MSLNIIGDKDACIYSKNTKLFMYSKLEKVAIANRSGSKEMDDLEGRRSRSCLDWYVK